jgi:uncharacterized protein YsxB (DUF464 family)
MIDVCILKKDNTISAQFTGHANAGARGSDLVCCAVSTLFYTLAHALDGNKHMLDEFSVEDESGKGEIICTFKSEYEANIECICDTILIGLYALKTNYPDKIKIFAKNEN